MRIPAFVICVLLSALAGCGGGASTRPDTPPVAPPAPAPAPEVAPPPPPPPPPPEPTAAERRLASAVALYDAGDFNGALKALLETSEIWTTTGADAVTIKIKAHKYAALSYCVTNRRTLCRQEFVEALKLDPSFELAPTERTHPIWGAEYDRAKASLAQPAKPAPKPLPAPTKAAPR